MKTFQKVSLAGTLIFLRSNEKMNINEEKRSQWQALKGMGFKAHWDYFWDYYKIHVIVAVIVIAVVVSLVKDIVSQKPFALSCAFINTASMNEPVTIKDGFAAYEKIDTSKYTVSIDASSTIDLNNPDQYSIANSERIYAMITARDLDIIMADEAIFKNYVDNEIFQDLSQFFSKEELDALGDKVFYEGSTPVGIILENNTHLNSLDYYPGEPAYIGVVTASQRTDVASDFIRYMLQ